MTISFESHVAVYRSGAEPDAVPAVKPVPVSFDVHSRVTFEYKQGRVAVGFGRYSAHLRSLA
jgi:hypothetical protein